MHFTLQAVRFYYLTSQAKYLLLGWLARHIDQAETVELWLPTYEQPNTWFPDLDLKLEPVFVAPMGRVLDIAGLGGMQVGPGSLHLRIRDPFCHWNEGIWKLSEQAGVLDITPSREAQCELTIQGLSALVYGVTDPADFDIRGWGNPSHSVQAVMRSMFPLRLPYLHEYY